MKRVPLDFKEIDTLSKILCYPKSDNDLCKKRLEELKSLKIKKIILAGNHEISGLKIIGKGCTSVVVLGEDYNNRVLAIKIRRTDATRESLVDEGKKLLLIGKYGLAPKVYAFSKNFIVMDFIKGVSIRDFIMHVNDKRIFKKTLRKLLEKSYLLDRIGLIHMELSRAEGHIIVSSKDYSVYFIDFETSSFISKKTNLTQIASFLFFKNSTTRSKVLKMLEIERNNLIAIKNLLKIYKKSKNNKLFYKILYMLNLAKY